MTITTPNIREELDNGVLQRLADVARELDAGALLGFLIQSAAFTETGIVPVADVATLAAPAQAVWDLVATAGVFTGRLALKIGGPEVTPLTGEAVWAPNSDTIRLNADDAITALSVKYARADDANTVTSMTSRTLEQRD